MTILFAAFEASGLDQVLDAGNGGNQVATDAGSPYNSHSGIRFNTDGTVEKTVTTDGAAVWVSHGTWVNDPANITGNEEVRFTSFSQLTGTLNWTSEAAADDTWIGITTTRTWIRSAAAAGDHTWTCTFEVRDTSTGATTGTRSYTFGVDNVI